MRPVGQPVGVLGAPRPPGERSQGGGLDVAGGVAGAVAWKKTRLLTNSHYQESGVVNLIYRINTIMDID